MKDYLQEGGYKRNKSIYTPPILQLGKFTSVNWVEDILPEIIWIGILQKHFGLGLGSKLALQISETTSKLTGRNNTWLAPLSSYNYLKDDEKEIISNEMKSLNYLKNYETAFTDITFLYPKFPLAFLASDISKCNKDLILKEFKVFLSSLFDRTNFTTTFMQATAVDMAFQTGIFTVAPNTTLAKFDEISKFPVTDLSKQVASAIRSSLNLFFSSNNSLTTMDISWRSYFWNRGLELEKCY